MNPNTQKWKKLGNPHEQTNRFFQLFSGASAGLQKLLNILLQFLNFGFWDLLCACSKIKVPPNPTNLRAQFGFAPTDRDLGKLAENATSVAANGIDCAAM
jgi:hypothetical protein